MSFDPKRRRVSFFSHNLRLNGSYYHASPNSPAVLFLHGGGQSRTDRYRQWQLFLARRGISSLAFDFPGCGKSDGSIQQSSLSKRIDDAQIALAFLMELSGVETQSVVVVGSSMGGHVSARLAGINPTIRGLILHSPAAYGRRVEGMFFGPKFAAALRNRNSWTDSPAFSALKRYRGRIMVVYGQYDNVVPGKVKSAYRDLVGSRGFSLIVQGIGHRQLSPKHRRAQAARKTLFAQSALFIASLFQKANHS